MQKSNGMPRGLTYYKRGGKVSKGDGMDIHHKGDNLTVESASKNRGRKEKSRVKGSKRK